MGKREFKIKKGPHGKICCSVEVRGECSRVLLPAAMEHCGFRTGGGEAIRRVCL